MHRMSNISVRFYSDARAFQANVWQGMCNHKWHEADSRMYYFVAGVSTAVSQTFERAFGKTTLVRMSPHD